MSLETGQNASDQWDTEKKKYFSDFALAHLTQMRILRDGRVLGTENYGWRNVSEHCLVEAVGVDILAEHLGANRSDLVKAALIHDWFKRTEIETMHRLPGRAGYEEAALRERNELLARGVEDRIIQLAQAVIAESADPKHERTIEEKIMHYVDCITSNDSFVNSYRERFQKQRPNQKFSEDYRSKYAGKSLEEVQTILSSEEQAEFEAQLGLKSGTLPTFLRDALGTRIREHGRKSSASNQTE